MGRSTLRLSRHRGSRAAQAQRRASSAADLLRGIGGIRRRGDARGSGQATLERRAGSPRGAHRQSASQGRGRPAMTLDSLGAVGTAVDLIIKPTVVLAAAAVAVAVLHRASASIRHLIWLLALGGAVVVVAITPAVPSVPIPMPVSLTPSAALGG